MLITVNPNESFDKLYTIEMVKKYEGKSLGELPPHVFAIGDNALRNLRVFGISQSIIISGLTGSGKSENTKFLLKFFSTLAKTSFAPQMLDANILLEAFGNARTPQNVNSSRFIKVIQVLKRETFLFETYLIFRAVFNFLVYIPNFS